MFVILIFQLTKLFILGDNYRINREYLLTTATPSNIENHDMADLIIPTRSHSLPNSPSNNNGNKSPHSIWKIFTCEKSEVDVDKNQNKRVLSQAFLTEGFI